MKCRIPIMLIGKIHEMALHPLLMIIGGCALPICAACLYPTTVGKLSPYTFGKATAADDRCRPEMIRLHYRNGGAFSQ